MYSASKHPSHPVSVLLPDLKILLSVVPEPQGGPVRENEVWKVWYVLKSFAFPVIWCVFEHRRETRLTSQRQQGIQFTVKEMQETPRYRFQFCKTAVACLSPVHSGVTVPSPLPWRLWMRPGPIGCCISTRLVSQWLWILRSLQLNQKENK